MPMLNSIVHHTPPWVWGLLAALLCLGLWQRRTRRVAPLALLALPLAMAALGLLSMAPGFVAQPLAGLLWLAAWLLALAWMRRRPAPQGARWLEAEGRVLLPGSWLPLLIIVAIFALRYASAVSLALHPQWHTALALQGPLALAFGALTGLFLGRALALRALVRPEMQPVPAMQRS